MNSNQRTEFEAVLQRLYAGFNMPISETRMDAYWQGLAKMSLGTFSLTVDYALGENGPERIPSTSALWKISKQIRIQAPQPYKPRDLGDQSKALRVVNGLFLEYLRRRRFDQNFKGDIDVAGRRKECLRLVDWLSAWDEKELSSEIKEIKRMFEAAMALVQDKAA